MRLELMQERTTRAQSAARRRHANYGRRKTADGKIKREMKPLTPPHMHAADVTAQFLRDLGHPTTVIINRRGADQKPLWLKDAPWRMLFCSARCSTGVGFQNRICLRTRPG